MPSRVIVLVELELQTDVAGTLRIVIQILEDMN